MSGAMLAALDALSLVALGAILGWVIARCGHRNEIKECADEAYRMGLTASEDGGDR